MCSSPYSPRARARVLAVASSVRCRMARASSRKSFPSAVSVTPRGLRLNRSTPISSSKSCTWRLNAGWAMRSFAAALLKLKVSPTTTKYRKCRSSIVKEIMPEKHYSARKVVLGAFNERAVELFADGQHVHEKQTTEIERKKL